MANNPLLGNPLGGLGQFFLQSLLGQQTPNYMTPGINPNQPHPATNTGIGMPSQQQGLPPQSIPGGQQQQGGGIGSVIMNMLPYLISGGLGGAMGGKIGAGQAVSTLYGLENQRKTAESDRLQQILKQQREEKAAKDKERQEELGSVWINPQTLEQVTKGTPNATRISASEWIKIKQQKPPEVKEKEQTVWVSKDNVMQLPTAADDKLKQYLLEAGFIETPISRIKETQEGLRGPEPEKSVKLGMSQAELIQRSIQGDTEATKILEVMADREINLAKRKGDVAAATLTPEGLDLAATQFATTGQMPSMGMGASGTRMKIINRAAEMYPALDVASNAAAYSANRASLNQMQKSYDAIVSFERTTQKNLDVLLEASKGIVDTGSPILNRPVRYISEKVLGNTEIPAWRAARQIDVNEIAKIVSNPNMTGVLTNEAREEINSLVPEDVTIAQLLSVAKIMRRDMQNRKSSMEEQMTAIKDRLSINKPQIDTGGWTATGETRSVKDVLYEKHINDKGEIKWLKRR